jgi:hypothetical protein
VRLTGTTIFSAQPKTLSRAPGALGAGLGCLDRSHEGSRAETRCMASRLPGDGEQVLSPRSRRDLAPTNSGVVVQMNRSRRAGRPATGKMGVFNTNPPGRTSEANQANRSTGWSGWPKVTCAGGDPDKQRSQVPAKKQAQNQPSRGGAAGPSSCW